MMRPARQGWLEQLVEDHYDALYRYAYRLSGSSADAEDFTQEAFCTAQLKHEQLRDPGRVKAWLFSIVRNAYLHRLRTAKQHRALPLDGVDEIAGAPADDPTAIGADQLQQALNRLPEGYRTPLILFYFDEFSYREIAEQMNLPLGTVMSRLARAKAHLRKALLDDEELELASGEARRGSDGL